MKGQASLATQKSAVATLGRAPVGLLQRQCACGQHTIAGGECEECQKKATMQRAASGARAQTTIPPTVHEVLRSAGQPLDAGIREFFEPRFNHDFSHVRVHTDARAAESAQAVNAHAYAVGNHIVFGAQTYRPGQAAGRKLLAHELTHVVQQRGLPLNIQALKLDGGATDPLEGEARRAAEVIEAGGTAVVSMSAGPAEIHRQPLLTDDAAGGCGVCFRKDLKKVGNVAHDLIQTEFELMYPGLIRNFPISIQGKPFIITEGIPDLVLPTPIGLKIGEIKPANLDNYIEGDAKMEIYKRLANEKYNVPTPTIKIESLDVAPPPPMPFVEPAAANCPPQTLITGPSVRGVYGYLCWPPFKQLVGKCKCKKDEKEKPVPVPVPVTKKETEKETEKEKDTTPVGSPQPSPVPALALTALAMAALAFVIKKLGAKAVGGYAYAAATLIAVSYLLASGEAEARVGPGGEDPLVLFFKAMEQHGVPVPHEIQQAIENNPALKAKIEQATKHGGDRSAVQQQISQEVLKILQEHKSDFSQEDLELLLGAANAGGTALPKGDVTVQALRTMVDQSRTGAGSAAEGQPKINPWEKAKTEGDPRLAGLSAESKGKIEAMKGPSKSLFNATLSATASGPAMTDAGVARFVSIVPADLTESQAQTLIARLGPGQGKTLDQVLDELQAAVNEIRKSNASEQEGGTKVQGEPPVQAPSDKPRASVVDKDLIAKLAKIAASTNFSDLKPGDIEVSWKKEHEGEFEGQIRSGRFKAVASCSGLVIERKAKTARVRILASSPLVDKDANIVAPAGWLTNRELVGPLKASK